MTGWNRHSPTLQPHPPVSSPPWSPGSGGQHTAQLPQSTDRRLLAAKSAFSRQPLALAGTRKGLGMHSWVQPPSQQQRRFRLHQTTGESV